MVARGIWPKFVKMQKIDKKPSFFDISSLRRSKKNTFSGAQNRLKLKISTLDGLHLVPKIASKLV